MSAKLAQLLRLRAAQAAAKEQQGEAQEQLRRAKQRQGRRKAFGAKLERVDAVSMLLYVLNGQDPACAALWLERAQRQQRGAQQDRAMLERKILEHYQLCDEDSLAAAAMQTTAAANSIVGQAHAFFRDWRAATWVESENATKKLAVSTKALAARALGQGSAAVAAGGHHAPAGSALAGRVRVWAVHWRRRMGARLR